MISTGSIYTLHEHLFLTILNRGRRLLPDDQQLTSQLFIKDTYSKIAVSDPEGNNVGLYERARFIAESKSLNMVAPIFHDLFKMTQYLINGCDLRLRLYRTRSEFSIMSNEAT